MKVGVVLVLALMATACVPKFGSYTLFNNEPVEQLTMAAEVGDMNAQFTLGERYYEGAGILQNYKEAFNWYEKAAQQGHAGAQDRLGMMYFEGKSTPRETIQAHMWLNLAAAQNNQFAEHRDYVAKRMTAEQVAQAQELAHDWKPVPAKTLTLTEQTEHNIVVRKTTDQEMVDSTQSPKVTDALPDTLEMLPESVQQ